MRIGSRTRMAVPATLFGVLLFSLSVFSVHAQEEEDVQVSEVEAEQSVSSKYTITPVVANEKAKPRDIIKKELLLTNNTNRRIDLYLSVENIDPTEGAQDFVSPSVSDLAHSLANWIEITRGVIELGPQESRKVPYLIHVNLTAEPGSYFARIAVTNGPRREDLDEQQIGAELLLNLEVLDDAKERLQLGGFAAEDSIVLGEQIGFSYQVENIGNRLLEPRGSIRIFNRKGEEVGSVPLNADGVEISPDNKRQLAAVWNAAGRFGKYKAFLDLEYGENQLASVQDTVYFWVFPWKEMLAALVGVIVLGVIGTFIIHMRAIAQPTPQAVAAEPVREHPREEAPFVPMPVQAMQTQTVLAARPGARARVESVPTVQTSPAAAPVAAPRPVPQNTGSTISLAPRGGRGQVSTDGATISLASRGSRARRR